MSRVAVLSLHTSPLAQPGQGDAGGMNVYVRELAAALAQAGVDATVFVRRWSDAPASVEVEPGFRVVHIDAGPPEMAKEALPGIVDSFMAGVRDRLDDCGADVLHANYWLSAVAGHRLKHQLDLPLVSTFHTLARVKAATGDPEPRARAEAEAEVVACSDLITASSAAEARQLADLYGADPARIEVMPPGVDHALFSPGDRAAARAALGLGAGPVLLFVGRIQPLKGLDAAVETLAELDRAGRSDARLVAVGGASGASGARELDRVAGSVRRLGLTGRVDFVPPQPHHRLSAYYRAADVCLVPSRSESFGLVALEAAACGTPVVASDVGGLRTLVDHGRTGYRVDGRSPRELAAAAEVILADPDLAEAMAGRATAMAAGYTWAATAGRARRIYDDLAAARRLVDCMA